MFGTAGGAGRGSGGDGAGGGMELHERISAEYVPFLDERGVAAADGATPGSYQHAAAVTAAALGSGRSNGAGGGGGGSEGLGASSGGAGGAGGGAGPAKPAAIESQQYEPDESEVWRHHQLQRHFEDKHQRLSMGKKRAFKRWVLTLIIGCVTGLFALIVMTTARAMLVYKFKLAYLIVDAEKAGKVLYGTAFVVFTLCNMLMVTVAWAFVMYEPLAAGSGIPEIKCFLNGINIPRIVRIKTMLCKMAGVTFAVGGSLPVGKEGPMVHSGGVLAAGISQGKSNTFGFDTSFSKFQDFRNDREKRDFVACGAAAGVAAAFGAPVGGVLFSLEEGASFWSTKLTWRSFFCAMITVATLFFARTAQSLWGQPDQAAMFSFGEFFFLEGESGNYSVWELLPFLLIGCMGGLIGACFNALNEWLSVWRSHRIVTSRQKLWEVLTVAGVVSVLSYALPVCWYHCTKLPTDMDGWSDQEKDLRSKLVPLYCDEDTEYNELASLFFTDADTAIKQLFHFREEGNASTSTISSGALFLFFLPYVLIACCTYGISVPSGLFVPSLLSGAAFGRLVGHLLHKVDHTSGTFADSGTYALIGAAAVLGGMSRMTISLSVIILEATGDMQYVLPLMLTLMAARWVGNVFNEGLYDVHIRLNRYAFLEESVPLVATRNDLVVGQVMHSPVITMESIMRVGAVNDILRRTQHHCYPVVDNIKGGVLTGVIMRKVLTVLLRHRAFGPPNTNLAAVETRRLSPLVNWSALECIYPRYPKIESIHIGEQERQSILDLRPYIDNAPHTVRDAMSVQRAYRMFRSLGLRHVIVVDEANVVQGVVTRHELTEEHLSIRASQADLAGENRQASALVTPTM